MNDRLQLESEKLLRSWMQHEPAWLRDYLVSGVEDPRINVQSILSRHFVARALTGDSFRELMGEEIRFAAAVAWILELAAKLGDADGLREVWQTLRRGGDNTEGVEIPRFVVQTSARLPAALGGLCPTVPNYVEVLLCGTQFEAGKPVVTKRSLDTFLELWKTALSGLPLGGPHPRLSLIEPACGSANDYRFLDACGLAEFLDYTGFDLCATNISNARALFPAIRFEVGNVFAISAEDKAFDFCLVHDLFEHLSLEGLEVAAEEVCRVTRRGLCIGFFQMDEIPEHIVRPIEEYHWNLLSMAGMRESFARHGFVGQVLHIGSFLRRQVGCEGTHNWNAYTFMLRRAGVA